LSRQKCDGFSRPAAGSTAGTAARIAYVDGKVGPPCPTNISDDHINVTTSNLRAGKKSVFENNVLQNRVALSIPFAIGWDAS